MLSGAMGFGGRMIRGIGGVGRKGRGLKASANNSARMFMGQRHGSASAAHRSLRNRGIRRVGYAGGGALGYNMYNGRSSGRNGLRGSSSGSRGVYRY